MFNSSADALTTQLHRLYYMEAKIRRELKDYGDDTGSGGLKAEIKRYAESADIKLLKLERIFHYLMQEPMREKNEVINNLLDETKHMLSYTRSQHLKNIMISGCMQNINAYKISAYKIAYMFAVNLEMDTASDLLQQVLESELATAKAFASLAIEEFNSPAELVIA